MKKKDTPSEPVDSIEDDIKAIIDEKEVIEPTDEAETNEDELPEEKASEETEEVDETGDDSEADKTGDKDAEESEEGSDEASSEGDLEDSEGEGDNKLEAPEHWAAPDREVFNEQTPKAQEWLLKRHKEMEGNLTRKSQDFATDKRQLDAITDALRPHEAEFAQAGLDHAGAVRQLASWHNSLRTGGKAAILQLAGMYNIDMSEEVQEIDPSLAAIKQELSVLRNQTTQQQATAQQEKQDQLFRVIKAFESETDGNGLKHPHFAALEEDLVKIFNNAATLGKPIELSDAYKQALIFRPDLTPLKKEAVKVADNKADQLEKVKKAKKAATGIKSSGATKQKRADLSLEEEIASHM